MWSGRNKAWNVSCNLASHGYPVPNTSENMKPQCHNENSFIYIIIEYNQHLVEEKEVQTHSSHPDKLSAGIINQQLLLLHMILLGSKKNNNLKKIPSGEMIIFQEK